MKSGSAARHFVRVGRGTINIGVETLMACLHSIVDDSAVEDCALLKGQAIMTGFLDLRHGGHISC